VGPVALVYPDGVFYQNIKVADVAEIVEEHLPEGTRRYRVWSATRPAPKSRFAEMRDVEFFNRQGQDRAAQLRPDRPAEDRDYIARDGYGALAKAAHRHDPETIVAESAGLGPARPRRRRLSDGLKWRFAQQQKEETSTSCATPTRATPAPSWTAPCSKAIRTR